MSLGSEVKIEIDQSLYAELLGSTMALRQIIADLSDSRLFKEAIPGVAAVEVRKIEERLRDAGKLATMRREACQQA
jgi:hypothetical protein